MTILFLDDLRNPFLDLEKKLPSVDITSNDTIIWVRNWKEFTQWIEVNGLPDVVSFDHDLHPEHYTPEFFWNDYELSKKYQESVKGNYKEKTGEDCAIWLLNFCNVNKLEIPETFVHSANPIGADWIRSILPFNLIKEY